MHDRISRPSDILPVVFFLSIATIAGFFLLMEDDEINSVPVAEQTQDDPQARVIPTTTGPEPALATNTSDASTPDTSTPVQPREPNQLAFMDQAFTTLSRWQPDEVRPLLAPSTQQAVNDEQLRHVLEVMQTKLGGLVSYETPAPVRILESAEASAAATHDSLHSFEFVAHYTEGDALVNLVLQDTQQGFSLYHFDIEMKQGTRPLARN